ncbi:MAG TPA: hypothetical protein VGX48_00500 [Pyrinomonadaceae bacterium]|jgi:hypothetical protein|nr:hypothetical protein [Pyrinomonadaceae bacterium]
MEALVDNDILMKGACYNLLDELLLQTVSSTKLLGILGATRFVVAKKIRKRALRGDKGAAVKSLEAFIQRVTTVEPTSEEQRMAADFELAAQRAGVALDTGESQLCAVLIIRAVRQLYTGDKRAIQAMQELLEADTRLRSLCNRVKCLEQLVLQSITEDNVSLFRAAICSEPETDMALTICFSCASKGASLEEVNYALTSYINDLRKSSPQILIG